MAEILFAAQDLPSGFQRGDPIVAEPDGWVWGASEGLPDFWIVTVTGLPWQLVAPHIQTELWEPAQPNDPEFIGAVDAADRRVWRHRRGFRVMWDEIPSGWLTQLETTGRLTVTTTQARPYVRRIRWNRAQGQLEKTTNEVF